jgi:hypothetical protein
MGNMQRLCGLDALPVAVREGEVFLSMPNDCRKAKVQK